MKIAIFGTASPTIPQKIQDLSFEIGKYLADKYITVVTGGCIGVPGYAIDGAIASHGVTEAFYPDLDEIACAENKNAHNNDALHKYHSKNFFDGFTERSLCMINAVDGAIIINGRIGTLSEFTIAVEEGLDVCVIEGSGGVADHLSEIIKLAEREIPNKVIFAKNWKTGIDELIQHIHDKKEKTKVNCSI